MTIDVTPTVNVRTIGSATDAREVESRAEVGVAVRRRRERRSLLVAFVDHRCCIFVLVSLFAENEVSYCGSSDVSLLAALVARVAAKVKGSTTTRLV
jgi:hypothetical protein